MDETSNIKTNIVPVNPDQINLETQDQEQPGAEEDYNTDLAQNAINFMEAEFKGHTDDHFWKCIRDLAQAKLPPSPDTPTAPVKPMTLEEQKQFAQESVQWGRFEGMKVGTVLRKDREYLERMALNPLPFQVKLRRFLAAKKSKEN